MLMFSPTLAGAKISAAPWWTVAFRILTVVYLFPNIHVRGRLARTNTVSNTAFRGFGAPQGMFIAECLMEEVADQLSMPVERLREINMYKTS